ncbi:hypothetical protein DL770_008261 [Monosporascus sp. CRB-9-2]|nr:hypothetical protein DL770_008261 [Monosporascus sp. CRB-9-2]
MASQYQNTVWLWMEGAFARRIMYQLLIKGLVESPAALLRGETTTPSLRVIRVQIGSGYGWECVDRTAEPHPKGASNPCLRTTDLATGVSQFIYESTSITQYLEEVYPDSPMQPKSAIDRAKMLDILGKINLTAVDSNYFLRNTVPEHGAIMGLEAADQSRTAAMNARSCETKGMLKIQEWAVENGMIPTSGWLTPGVDGPGLADVAFVSTHRFIELVYGFDAVGDERLRTLAAWYERFKQLPWWKELEDREGVLLPMLDFGKRSRASWFQQEKDNEWIPIAPSTSGRTS